MIYLCLDTNIYIKQLTDISENDDLETNYIPPHGISVLSVLLDNDCICLLLPEVIELELEKANRSYENIYRNNYSKLREKNAEFSEEIWNEAKDIIKKIELLIEQEQDKKILYWQKTYKIIKEFFENKKIVKLPLDSNTILQNERKRISGLIADRNSNDELIKMQLSNFINNKMIDEDDFIFITNNKQDFFGECVENSSKFSLPWMLKKNCYGYYSLNSFLKNFNNEYDLDIDDSEPLESLVDLDPSNVELLDEQIKNIEEYNKIYYEILISKIREEFNKKLYSSSEKIREIRDTLLLEINNILRECRNTKSWDDHSEYKLRSWLEGNSEQEIYFLTLSELLIIKKNLQLYLKIHLDMDKNS